MHELVAENDMQRRKSRVLIEELDEQGHVIREPYLNLVTRRNIFTESTARLSVRVRKGPSNDATGTSTQQADGDACW